MKGQYLKTAVAACLIMSAMIAGTISFSFFLEPVTSELGFDRSQFSIYFSIFSIVGMATLPFYGRIISRFGTRPMVIVCGIWSALSISAFSLCSSLMSFYIVAVAVGLGFFGCSYAVVPVIVSSWFAKNSGTVMGMASTTGGCFGILCSFLMPSVIEKFSWHTGYIVLGLVIFLLTVPEGIFLLRSNPAQVGLKPLGVEDSEDGDESAVIYGMTYKEALRTPALWIMLLAFLLFAITSTITQHMPAHFVGLGFSSMMAGVFMSVMSAGVLLTSFAAGAMVDKIGLKKTILVFSVLYVAAFLALPVSLFVPLICVVVVFISICNVNMTIFAPEIAKAGFGTRDYASIWGLGSMANVLGQAIGAPLLGLSFDITGSYVTGMIACAVAVAVACLLVMIVMKKSSDQ